MGKLSNERVTMLALCIVAIGAAGFYHLPGMIVEDAQGSRLVNSIYCSCITLTTVGFGDICPSKDLSASGKTFILLLSLFGLGFFLGPVMDLASSWKHRVPGGLFAVASITLVLGILLFSNLEGLSQLEAAYFSVIAGLTIGYGDFSPSTDLGKLVISLYVILAINVTGALLEPGKKFLVDLCTEDDELPLASTKKEV